MPFIILEFSVFHNVFFYLLSLEVVVEPVLRNFRPHTRSDVKRDNANESARSVAVKETSVEEIGTQVVNTITTTTATKRQEYLQEILTNGTCTTRADKRLRHHVVAVVTKVNRQ